MVPQAPPAQVPVRPWAAAAGSLAVAVALRLLLLAERRGGLGPLHLGTPDAEWGSHVLDAAWYDTMARQVLGLDGGQGGLLLDRPFAMAPAYGYVLAAVYALFGAEDPTAVALLQALAGGLTAALTAWLGARLAPAGASPRLAAWGAGLALATYPVALHYDLTLLGASLATLLTALSAVALLRAWRPGAGPGAALLGGLALGLATTARANLLLVAPFIALAFALRVVRGPTPGGRARLPALAAALAVALGIGLPVGLTAAHNQAAGGELVLVSANGGINLYRGNNPYVVEEPVVAMRLPADRDALAEKSRLVASREVGHWLSPAEADRHWTRRALQHAAEDPGRYLGLCLRKLHRALSPFEQADDTDLAGLRQGSRVLGPLPWLLGPLTVLGLLGLGLSGPWRGDPLRWPDLPTRILLLVGLASISLFFVLSRYRLPLLPILFAHAGGAVAWSWMALQRRRWRALGGVLVLGGALGTLLSIDPQTPWLPASLLADRGHVDPPPCAIDAHRLRAPRIEAEYRRAKAELLAGERALARQRLSALLQADPEHLPAAVDLSAMLLEEGELRGAATLAELVLEQDGCDDKAWANLGTARLRQGRPGDAARAFQQAHALDPAAPEYEAALGEALLAVGEEAEALPLLQSAVRWGPELWQPRAILGRRALRAGRYDEAVVLLREAVAARPERVELQAALGLSLAGAGDLDGARAVLADAKRRGMGRQAAILALEQGIERLSRSTPPAPALPGSPP